MEEPAHRKIQDLFWFSKKTRGIGQDQGGKQEKGGFGMATAEASPVPNRKIPVVRRIFAGDLGQNLGPYPGFASGFFSKKIYIKVLDKIQAMVYNIDEGIIWPKLSEVGRSAPAAATGNRGGGFYFGALAFFAPVGAQAFTITPQKIKACTRRKSMAYKLDYNIDRDTDRLEAVRNILENSDQQFRAKDLELMANYLLYGKDENGKNALQRGEIDKTTTKHNSYRKKSDKEESLDAIIEMSNSGSPMPKITAIGEKYIYKRARQCITPEDETIPGMKELQDAIRRLDLSIRFAEGKLDPSKLPADYSEIKNSEHLYKMKHILIDMRRHQYYLKDAYRPAIRLLGVQSGGKQLIDWGGKVHCGANNYVEFDWENYNHIAALLRNYSAIKMAAFDDPTGWQTTFIMDFDRYYNMANIPKIYDFLVTLRIDGLSFKEIAERMEQKFGKAYGIAYLSCLLSEHIPRKISLAAKRHRLLTEDSVKVQQCPKCARWLPGDPVFFKQSGFCFECNRGRRQWREKERA